MRAIDLIAETFHSLTSNKVRSGLTVLGIVVGIASVIAMLALGAGSQASIESSIQAAGSNLLTVMPSSPGSGDAGPGWRRARSSRSRAKMPTRSLGWGSSPLSRLPRRETRSSSPMV